MVTAAGFDRNLVYLWTQWWFNNG